MDAQSEGILKVADVMAEADSIYQEMFGLIPPEPIEDATDRARTQAAVDSLTTTMGDPKIPAAERIAIRKYLRLLICRVRHFDASQAVSGA